MPGRHLRGLSQHPFCQHHLGEHDPRTPGAKRDPDSAERVLSLSDDEEEDQLPGGEEKDANEGCSRLWRAQT